MLVKIYVKTTVKFKMTIINNYSKNYSWLSNTIVILVEPRRDSISRDAVLKQIATMKSMK